MTATESWLPFALWHSSTTRQVMRSKGHSPAQALSMYLYIIFSIMHFEKRNVWTECSCMLQQDSTQDTASEGYRIHALPQEEIDREVSSGCMGPMQRMTIHACRAALGI